MKLLYFDLETTGTDTERDRIVQFAFMDQDGTVFKALIDPDMTIPAAASAIHGITNETVRDHPKFEQHAVRIQALVSSRTLVGYNSKSFDVKMLHRQLVEAGQRGIHEDHPHIDVYVLWQELEKRTLANAAQRYGVEASEAHDALGDVATTRAVYLAMANMYKVDHDRARIITSEADINRWVTKSPEGHRWRFGKHRGELVKSTPSYVQWIMDKDFPSALKRLCQQELMT